MKRWPEMKAAGLVESWCPDVYEQRYWTEIFDRMYGGARDVWDYMWMFACWSQSGLTVLPSVNLVRNDGWGPDATHTTSPPTAIPPTAELYSIQHPPYVVRNTTAHALTFELNFAGAQIPAI